MEECGEDMTGYIKQFMHDSQNNSNCTNGVAKRLNFNDTLQLYGMNKRKSTSFDGRPSEKKAKTSKSDDTIDSPWEQRRVRANLLEAKAQITRLENNIESQHALRREMELLFQTEKQSLQNQKINDTRTIADLEARLKDVRTREREARSELQLADNKYDQLKRETDTKIQALEKKINEITDELEVIKEESVYKKHQDEEREEENTMEINDIQYKNEEYGRKIKELTEQLTSLRDIDKKHSVLEAQHEISKMRVRELELEIEKHEEWKSQSKLMQRKLAGMPDMERDLDRLRVEVVQLRDCVQNKLLLEEKVHDLQSRLASSSARQEEMAKLQIALDQAEDQLKGWKDLGKSYWKGDAISPRELKLYIDDLQQKEVILTDEKMKAESEQKKLRNELDVTKQALQKSTKELTDAQNSVKQHQKLLHRVQRKLHLVGSERDSYKSVLDSYEQDLTICNPGNLSNPEVQLKKRLDDMDRILAAYKNSITKLEADLQEAQPLAQSGLSSTAPIRVEQISRLQDDNNTLKRENEQLRRRRDELEQMMEYRSLKGDFNPVASKIVHFNQNPLAISQENYKDEVVRLQAEVDKLKKTINKMKENGTQEMTQNVSMTASQELLILRDQVKTHESKMQRLKDVFASSSQDFRDACYIILGYKVDRVSKNNVIYYRLTNQYADSESDHLNFQITPEGTVNLLENDYSLSLGDFISKHLEHQGSIPVFLSALTIDLFKRTTIAINDEEEADEEEEDEDNENESEEENEIDSDEVESEEVE